jgi:tRNA(Ile2) C34 agmatinyltransferase TiaS
LDGQCDKWQEQAVKNTFTQKDIKDKEFENGRKLTGEEIHSIVKKKGVCKRCEGICYRDGDRYRCPRCGWTGNTISVSEYQEGRLYR